MTSSVVTQSPQDRTDILVLLLRRRRSSGLAEVPRQRAAGTTAFFAPHQATYPPTRPHMHPHHTPRLLLILGRDIFMTVEKTEIPRLLNLSQNFTGHVTAIFVPCIFYHTSCNAYPAHAHTKMYYAPPHHINYTEYRSF